MAKEIKKIKINHTANAFWVVPSISKIFTAKHRNYVIKHAKTLEEIIEANDLLSKEMIFNFNGDEEFKLFNQLQKIRELNIVLDYKKIDRLDAKEKIVFNITDKIDIVFDYKSIVLLKKGTIPFMSRSFLESQSKNDETISLYWRKSGFEIL